jgi:hypothetical protein
MSHIYHEPIAEAGLCEDCPGCERLAEHPLHYFDATNLRHYLMRTVNWLQHEGDPEWMPRNKTESTAMHNLEDVIRTVRTIEDKGVMDMVILNKG